MSNSVDLTRAREVELVMVDTTLVERTNWNPCSSKVAGIVAQGINWNLFGALPAYFNGHRWMITDGNHRFIAACILGVKYVPIAPLTLDEFNLIAFSNSKTVDLLVRVPDHPKFFTHDGKSRSHPRN